MKVPVQATIGGYKFAISYVDELRSDDGTGESAQTMPYEHKVKVSKTMHQTERQIFATLFHEMMHCALEVTGHSERFTSVNDEESLIYALENMLGPLLCFNPNAPIKYKEVDIGKDD